MAIASAADLAVGHCFLAFAGALSDDPAIQAIIAEELGIIGRRLIEGLDPHDHAHDVAVLAVHGWLLFVRAVCVEWIQTQTISRTELTQMCLHAFAGAVAPASDPRTAS